MFSEETIVSSKIVLETTRDEQETIIIRVEDNSMSIKEALKFTLDLKANMMNNNSFVQYKSRIGLFEKWLKENEYYNNPINFISKKIVIQYLNNVLTRTSTRNRNNSRTDIASMFQLLEDNEEIKDNFVRKTPVLKSIPKRNKTTHQNWKKIFMNIWKKKTRIYYFL
jgi:hypothetical protein